METITMRNSDFDIKFTSREEIEARTIANMRAGFALMGAMLGGTLSDNTESDHQATERRSKVGEMGAAISKAGKVSESTSDWDNLSTMSSDSNKGSVATQSTQPEPVVSESASVPTVPDTKVEINADDIAKAGTEKEVMDLFAKAAALIEAGEYRITNIDTGALTDIERFRGIQFTKAMFQVVPQDKITHLDDTTVFRYYGKLVARLNELKRSH